MNMLVDGEWRTDADSYANEDGAFERGETTFRDRIHDDPSAAHPPEPGRYHLYVSYACPWAHRTLIARRLLGLEDALSVSVVDPFRAEDGWQFSPERDGCTPDPIQDADYLRELYVRADPDATCRVTVPVLWDREHDTIVNNESIEIVDMLDAAFETETTLYPDDQRDAVERTVEEIYEPINNGVYRAGFATEQAPYDAAIDDLFEALEYWDGVLADRRYLVGDRLTAADVCLFTTLVRFDRVYHTHFKCNVATIREYENLWPYLRDCYQTPGVGETVHMDHIAEHYYRTHPDINPHRIVARGPPIDFEAPHDRDGLSGRPPLSSA